MFFLQLCEYKSHSEFVATEESVHCGQFGRNAHAHLQDIRLMREKQNLSIKDTLNEGRLSNEDTACSPNHKELCTNLPLK